MIVGVILHISYCVYPCIMEIVVISSESRACARAHNNLIAVDICTHVVRSFLYMFTTRAA